MLCGWPMFYKEWVASAFKRMGGLTRLIVGWGACHQDIIEALSTGHPHVWCVMPTDATILHTLLAERVLHSFGFSTISWTFVAYFLAFACDFSELACELLA